MAKPPKNVDAIPHIVEASEHYSAPIPHPTIMKGYAEIDASFPDRIFAEFEKNSEHFRKQEEAGLIAKIDEVRRAQWMAFGIAMFLLGIVVVSVSHNPEEYAAPDDIVNAVRLLEKAVREASKKDVTFA